MIELTEQVGLVTGAARGIGRAVAEALAEAGADVVLTDVGRQVEGLTYSTASDPTSGPRSRRARRRGAGGRGARRRARPDRVAAVRAAVDTFGRLDLLVANAGVASWPKTTWQATRSSGRR